MITPSLRIKKVFLSFIQTYFSGHTKYKWDINPKNTKIIVADKYATELGIAAMRPTVIIDRGPIGLTGRYRSEALPNNDSRDSGLERRFYSKSGGSRQNNYKLTQTWGSNINLRVMAKRHYIADEIANDIFIQLWAHREWFKEQDKGIHTMNGLTLGREQTLKLSAGGIEVANVDISFNVERQETVRLGERMYNCRVYNGEDELYEGIDFHVTPSGVQIELVNDPGSQLNLTIDYIDAVTLEEKSDINLITVTGSNRLYTVPDNGKIYGYYNLFESFTADNTGTEIINEN